MNWSHAIRKAHKYAQMKLPYVPTRLLWHVANRQCPSVPASLINSLDAHEMRFKAIRKAIKRTIKVVGYRA